MPEATVRKWNLITCDTLVEVWTPPEHEDSLVVNIRIPRMSEAQFDVFLDGLQHVYKEEITRPMSDEEKAKVVQVP